MSQVNTVSITNRTHTQPIQRARWRKVLRFCRRNRFLVVGLLIVGLIVGIGLLGPFLYTHDHQTQDWGNILSAPGDVRILGTDDLGRDELARLMYGAHISLLVAV